MTTKQSSRARMYVHVACYNGLNTTPDFSHQRTASIIHGMQARDYYNLTVEYYEYALVYSRV